MIEMDSPEFIRRAYLFPSVVELFHTGAKKMISNILKERSLTYLLEVGCGIDPDIWQTCLDYLYFGDKWLEDSLDRVKVDKSKSFVNKLFVSKLQLLI